MIAIGIMLIALLIAVFKMDDRRYFIASISVILVDAVIVCLGKNIGSHFLMYFSYLFTVLIVAIVNYKIYDLHKESKDE